MSDPITALDGAHFAGDVTVQDAGLTGMVAIRGDFGADAFRSAVSDVTGHAMPDTRGMVGDATGGLAWMSPDELMLFCGYAEAEMLAAKLREALAGTHHMVTVLSDARAVIRLHGDTVREVLAKGAPVDMATFGTGEIRRTRLGQVAVAFWLTGEDAAELVCFRSVAGFVFEWLSTAARKGGRVGYLV
ncbi:sarcosine oxidase subunit gamma [Roseobacter sp. HKCCA0434]|uniref:sarcosine oxidase subunit gamma n=1 Tax=Roseobacter sp. HKCCA0434 TaxID=3079297 RepID=UPI002905CE05|nr:sarcosine oxidase subunit gamma family protein [Roseobacter sp. HKCCA0434]